MTEPLTSFTCCDTSSREPPLPIYLVVMLRHDQGNSGVCLNIKARILEDMPTYKHVDQDPGSLNFSCIDLGWVSPLNFSTFDLGVRVTKSITIN